jgi:hypothetical protein
VAVTAHQNPRKSISSTSREKGCNKIQTKENYSSGYAASDLCKPSFLIIKANLFARKNINSVVKSLCVSFSYCRHWWIYSIKRRKSLLLPYDKTIRDFVCYTKSKLTALVLMTSAIRVLIRLNYFVLCFNNVFIKLYEYKYAIMYKSKSVYYIVYIIFIQCSLC